MPHRPPSSHHRREHPIVWGLAVPVKGRRPGICVLRIALRRGLCRGEAATPTQTGSSEEPLDSDCATWMPRRSLPSAGKRGWASGGTHAERTTCVPVAAVQEKGRGPPWGHAGAEQAHDRHGQVQAERALDSHASEVRIALGTRTITGGSKDVDRALAWPQYCTPEKSRSASPAL